MRSSEFNRDRERERQRTGGEWRGKRKDLERDWEREHHVRGEEEEEVLLTVYNK